MSALAWHTRHSDPEGGAAAVEMGFMLPILALLVAGIVEFGRGWNTQISLSGAAREGARVMAIENDAAEATTATINAAPSVQPPLTAADVAISPSPCNVGQPVTVTATKTISYFTSFIDANVTISGRGVMRCGG